MTTKTTIYRAAFAAIAMALAVSAPARADTILLNLIDPPGQTDTPFSLNFTAIDPLTTVTFAGYQVPSFNLATNIGVFLDNVGPNLLAAEWTFTAAPLGSNADQFDEGTGVNQLVFAGLTEGSYDSFTQQFATTAGSSYTLNFLFTNGSEAESFVNETTAPSGFQVSTSGSGFAAVPEPATWGMMVLGFGGLGALLRRRRAAVFA
jgi:hypothetical protein